MTQCEICGDGVLIDLTEKNEVRYKGRTKEITCVYSVCDGCHSDQADSEKLRLNKEQMTKFKAEVDYEEQRLQN
jgi:hypothetical protein